MFLAALLVIVQGWKSSSSLAEEIELWLVTQWNNVQQWEETTTTTCNNTDKPECCVKDKTKTV